MIELWIFGSEPNEFENTPSGHGELYDQIMLLTGRHGLASDVLDWCMFALCGEEYEHELFRVTLK